MKILVITQYFWPEDFRINDICRGLKEKGHEVEILTGLPNYPQGEYYKGYSWFKPRTECYDGMKVMRVPLVPRGKDNAIMLGLNYISFVITSLFHLPRVFGKDYDRIFVFQVSPITTAIPAILLKWFRKIPISIYIQDLWPETFYSIININNRTFRKIAKRFCITVYNAFHQLYIASQGYEEKLVEQGIDGNKIIYLPQWAEDYYSNSVQDKLEDEGLGNSFVVTFAGNIGKAQGVDTIIEAANLAKDKKEIKWVILGDGSEFENIKAKVKEYKLEETVILLGRKPSTEMPKYFKASQGLIVTLKDEDIFKLTLPAKVQSYMAAGKPILGAINGEGMKVIRKSNCGLAGPAEDHKSLYENVLRLYNMTPEQREALGRNGKEYFFNNYTRELLLEKLENSLKNIKY